MKEPIDVSVIQANFDELLDRASKGEYFLAQKDGIIMAAIISYEEYEVLVRSRAKTSDSELKKALEESQKQHKLGDVGTEEEIFKKLNKRESE